MKTIQITEYVCEKCGGKYSKELEASRCEEKEITQDKGVRVGDLVKVLHGDGAGEIGKVTDIGVLSKDWGHYAADRYHHTVYVDAKLINSYGNRFLTFDDYEPAEKK